MLQRDELVLVFEYQRSDLDKGEREDAVAVYGGTTKEDTGHNGMSETEMNGRIRVRVPLRHEAAVKKTLARSRPFWLFAQPQP
jgi:hypothetical protein